MTLLDFAIAKTIKTWDCDDCF